MVLTEETILFDFRDQIDLGLSTQFSKLRDQFYISKPAGSALADGTFMSFARLGDAWTARFTLALLR